MVTRVAIALDAYRRNHLGPCLPRPLDRILVIVDGVILGDEQVLDQQLYMLRRTAFSDAMHVCCAISTTGHGAGALVHDLGHSSWRQKDPCNMSGTTYTLG